MSDNEDQASDTLEIVTPIDYIKEYDSYMIATLSNLSTSMVSSLVVIKFNEQLWSLLVYLMEITSLLVSYFIIIEPQTGLFALLTIVYIVTTKNQYNNMRRNAAWIRSMEERIDQLEEQVDQP